MSEIIIKDSTYNVDVEPGWNLALLKEKEAAEDLLDEEGNIVWHQGHMTREYISKKELDAVVDSQNVEKYTVELTVKITAITNN